MSNLREYLANTNPRNSNSVFRIVSIAQSPSGHAVITWSSVGAVRYRVHHCDGMTGGVFNFLNLARPPSVQMDPAPPATPSTLTFTLTGAPQPGVTRFYRVKVLQ